MRIPPGPIRLHIVILAALALVQGGMAAPICGTGDAACGGDPGSGAGAQGLLLVVANATLSQVEEAGGLVNGSDDAREAGQEAAGNATTEIDGVVASQSSTTNPVAQTVQETVWEVVAPVGEAYSDAANNWPTQVNTPQAQTKYAVVEGGVVDVPLGPTSLPAPPMAPPRAPPEGLVDTAVGAIIGPRVAESAESAAGSAVYDSALRASQAQALRSDPDVGTSHADPTDEDEDEARPADGLETASSAVDMGPGLFAGLLIPSIVVAAIAGLFFAAWLALRRTVPARWLGGVPLATLFTRQTGSAVLRNPLRHDIHSIIQQEPGITHAMLARRVDAQPSSIRYHLHVLQREGHVQGRREGKVQHFYADASLANTNWKAHACLFLHRRAALAHAILSKPGSDQQGIVRTTDIPASRVSSCVQDLISAGLVTSRREGRHCHYFPTSLLEEMGAQGGLLSQVQQ